MSRVDRGRHQSVAELEARFGSRPIPGCPGRAILRAPSDLDLEALLDPSVVIQTYDTLPTARHVVHLALVRDGGIISFERPDGSWVHTLNTPEGFRRRLAKLGLRDPTTPLGPGPAP